MALRCTPRAESKTEKMYSQLRYLRMYGRGKREKGGAERLRRAQILPPYYFRASFSQPLPVMEILTMFYTDLDLRY